MSRRTLILIVLLVLVAGIAIGRYVLGPARAPAVSAGTRGAQDAAANAASRAMTFTQPKAPAP
ncbi:hypothetical protein ASC80_21835 [Afipia sp. Root123D2]|uniref:hypothetical protein n=1 Tax=Afipia sp. Root123D2 TaxID=1736436 RepID=UPI0007127A58|nr:hypothetical protein [Afipia sp. Root123D2]KQW18079.1 hypothetical protein ASC80_21835 [Afipia sp. Root123D2]